ncbi:MAG TPA: isochorismatase family cysteine hydrolase [Thermotogota bacterium]|jgi:nicotinamidase/pyrazinamidase|nr:cysteine hydrolase [Thermotogota bacterium]NLH18884.1 cysteine hydrolase [Thermotogaceae bacterium]OQC32929.1 MAG: nicotinamidase/pyrazinamidase [Thermotogota bacterium ADurb.Bin062]HNW46041.1 isochorismatase family cysteine hydrolase [Thermotogota bacterium]HNY81602.1 isochorismatase family cysteine hydrolase [Thermotogota bacterium]
MKALLVVDVQNDFFSPEGVLFNSRFAERIPEIIRAIGKAQDEEQYIITTQDWHKSNDPEFRLFPPHCLQNTWGADLLMGLKRSLNGYHRHIRIYKRYFTAFKETKLDDIFKTNRIQEVSVCGVMLNICILYTCEDLFYREIPTTVLMKASEGPSDEVSKWTYDQLKSVFGVTLA